MFIDIGDQKLYYEVIGSGRPLIMVHGNGEDHRIFTEASEVLKEHFALFLVDSRGHGQSSQTDELHYEQMADDYVSFMEQLDLHDLVFYGFSDGGIIGLLAAMKSERISRLIISGANLTPDGLKMPLRIFYKIQYCFQKDPRTALMLKEPHIDVQDLSAIRIPVTVIAGERDVIRLAHTRQIADNIPVSRLRIIPDASHSSYVVHRREIADIILEETHYGSSIQHDKAVEY